MGQDDRLRVLHVYRTYFPDPPGGLQEAIRQIALGASAYGIESRIFTLSPVPSPRNIQANEGLVVRCRSLAAPASCDLGGLDSLREFRKLMRWSDLVHYHFPWPFADVLHLLGEANKPCVMTYHSDIVRQRVLARLYSPLMRHTLRSMSAVVATSPAYAITSQVLSSVVQPNQLRTIPLGIADYSKLSSGQGENNQTLARLELDGLPFLLALGVLRYYKGLHTLVEAANAINGTIVIAGSGSEEAALKQLVADRAVKNILFAGQVSNSEKEALLKSCRALILPSHLRSEAFGMVLVEASMFAKPMVCCEVGSGTSFVNIHNETGFVVPPQTPRLLARACNQLLADEPLALRMGKNARERYDKLFSGPALGKAYAGLYREFA